MSTGVPLNQQRPNRPNASLHGEQSYSLLSIQRTLLSECIRSGDPGFNVEQVAVEFDDAIDEAAFLASVQHVMRSHEALGVRFDWSQPEQLTQQVSLDVVPSIRTVQADGESQLEQVLAEEREQGFDLSQPSQMRIVLLHHNNRNWGMVCTVHRVIADRASLEIVLHQVFAAYHEILAGRQPAELEVISLETLISREQKTDSDQRLEHDEAAKSFRQLLDGVDSPTPLPLNSKGLPPRIKIR